MDDSILNTFSNIAPVVVNIFNEFFARTSGVARNGGDTEFTLKKYLCDSDFLPLLDATELQSLVFSLKPNKAPGIDSVFVSYREIFIKFT